MFKTNKVPAIEERTVSGSSVSFNSAFALPLKACKVSFSATQASGTPSPSTPLPISGVSAIGLTANSTPVSVSLGDTRYGGELELITGKLTLSHALLDLGELTYNKGNRNNDDTGFVFYVYYTNAKSASELKCEEMKYVSGAGSWENLHANEMTHTGFYVVMVADYQTPTDFRTAMNGVHLLYQLAEPITIELSPTELNSITGNNTFSTDTGTLEITFSDLQEKSASGSVATFNTALAMPLVECAISFPPNKSGVEFITLTINGNNIIIDLDGERHGGYIDLVEKKGYFTWYKPNINNLNFSLTGSGLFQTLSLQSIIKSNPTNVVSPYIMSDSFTAVTSLSISGPQGANPSPDMVYASNAPGTVYFNYLGTRDIDTFKSFLANDNFIVERKNPIVIDLPDIPTLSTIIGNNSFASDSGSIELTFKDLDIAKRGNFREVFKLPS